MLEALETPLNWPLEFERQQKIILDLWQTCYVSLVHRTYFFLLFKGDPSDSIYMEVEVRRLSFLTETYSRGNQAVEDGRTLTLAARFSLSLSPIGYPFASNIFSKLEKYNYIYMYIIITRVYLPSILSFNFK